MFIKQIFILLLAAMPALAQVDSVNYLLGKFDPAKHPDFALIPATQASQAGMYLRKETLEAFTRMQKAAAKDGIALTVISATRNFERQKSIWEAKWTGARKVGGQSLNVAFPNPAERAKKILQYSSMPGTSRHHWGTDFDINSLSPEHYRTGAGKKTYEWLAANASRFGFCQAYTAKGAARMHGYEEEAWHWSYAPLAGKLLHSYNNLVNAKHISGFKGADALPFAEVLHFVNGVAPACKGEH